MLKLCQKCTRFKPGTTLPLVWMRRKRGGGYQGHISAVKKESRRIGYISSNQWLQSQVCSIFVERVQDNYKHVFYLFSKVEIVRRLSWKGAWKNSDKRITDGIGITGDGARLCKPGFLKVGPTNSRGSATGVLSSVADFMQRKQVCKFG